MSSHEHEHEHGHDHEHDHEAREHDPSHEHDVVTIDRLKKKSRIASLVNAGSGVIKMALGIGASSPVLATDAAHDFVDAWVYKKEGRNLDKSDKVEKARADVQTAKLLGQTAVVGAALETAVDMAFKYSPLPFLGLIGAGFSYISNHFIHKLFAHEDHDHAHGLKGHAETDRWTSLITIGASVVGFALQPALVVGAAAHVGLYARNYYKQKKRYIMLRDQAAAKSGTA